MTAKEILFGSSIAVVALGVAGLAMLGAIAKVPPGEYWTVVLGGAAVGVSWLLLLRALHLRSNLE